MINKQGWEIKKLRDICVIVSGSTPKTNITDYWNGDYNWVTPAELNDNDDIIYKTNRKITSKAIKETNLKLLPIGTVLLSSRAPIGKVAIAGAEMFSNQGFKNLICSDVIFNRYLFRFLKSKTQYLNNLGRGATFKEISKEIVQNVSIPLPPLPIQNQIVKELDTLQAIITKKKAQLEELDKLAQATFYDMFGDPVENEKGWIKKKLFELTSKLGDGIHGTPRYTDNGDYFFINGNNLKDGKVIITTATKKVSKEEYERHKTDLTKNTILISINGTIGNIAFYNQEKIMLGKSVCYLNLNNDIGIIYIYSLLKTNYFLEYAKGESTGSTIKNVSLKTMRNFNIPIPPLPLQNQFAKQIEAIEKQKELINQSIAETQLLFDSAMDNYFN